MSDDFGEETGQSRSTKHRESPKGTGMEHLRPGPVDRTSQGLPQIKAIEVRENLELKPNDGAKGSLSGHDARSKT
jgi:hypothetical protein